MLMAWWQVQLATKPLTFPKGTKQIALTGIQPTEVMGSSICYIVSTDFNKLTHWGWVMHICIGKLTNIGSDNGLLPGRRQAIIWTNAGILLIGPLGTNFSELLIVIHTFSFNEMDLKMSSAKWRPFCLSLNVLTPGAQTPGAQHLFRLIRIKYTRYDFIMFFIDRFYQALFANFRFAWWFCAVTHDSNYGSFFVIIINFLQSN